MEPASCFRIGIAHLSPVFLDLTATVDKVRTTTREAADGGARLVVFPEAYIPGFPIWNAICPPIDCHEYFCRLEANSMTVPSPELDRLRAAARDFDIYLSVGFNERCAVNRGRIYNSNILISPDGSVLNHHRKITPTFYEKLTWTQGDGAGLRVCQTDCGRIGMLICGENTNPLARFALLAQGEQVHVSSYPPVWPTHDPQTAETYDLAAAIRLRSAAHAFEAKVFTIAASGCLDAAIVDACKLNREAARILESCPRGISVVYGPDGKVVSERTQAEEDILYAEIDLDRCIIPKQFHDLGGGYNRFDIFHFSVDRTAQRAVTFIDESSESPFPTSQ